MGYCGILRDELENKDQLRALGKGGGDEIPAQGLIALTWEASI